jgi:hypothetical protein
MTRVYNRPKWQELALRYKFHIDRETVKAERDFSRFIDETGHVFGATQHGFEI